LRITPSKAFDRSACCMASALFIRLLLLIIGFTVAG